MMKQSERKSFTQLKNQQTNFEKRLFRIECFNVHLHCTLKHFFMQTFNINFTFPTNWAELGDKQHRYVFSLLAKDFSTDKLKTLCLLQWSCTKVIGRQKLGDYLLKKGSFIFEVVSTAIAGLLPYIAHGSPTSRP